MSGSNLLWHTGFAGRGSRPWSWYRVRADDVVGMLPSQAQFNLSTRLSRGLMYATVLNSLVHALLCVNLFKSKLVHTYVHMHVHVHVYIHVHVYRDQIMQLKPIY